MTGLSANMKAAVQAVILSTDATIVTPVIVDQDANGGAIRVIKLAIAHRPQEGNEACAAQDQRHRNKDQKAVHRAALVSRRALATTRTDDVDMAIAATSGVTIPASASGTARIL